MKFTGLRINWGIFGKCSEDLSQSCKRATEVWCSSRSWSCACWMLSWRGCCTHGHSTAGHRCCHQCPFSVAFSALPLSPAPSCRRAQTWETSFALPLPTPPGLKSAAPPVSTHSVCFPKLSVQWGLPAVTALISHGTSSQHFHPSLLGSPCTWMYVLPAKAHMLFLFLKEVIFHQAWVFHNWCNRKHKLWQDWSFLEHRAFPILPWPHGITSPKCSRTRQNYWHLGSGL